MSSAPLFPRLHLSISCIVHLHHSFNLIDAKFADELGIMMSMIEVATDAAVLEIPKDIGERQHHRPSASDRPELVLAAV